MFAYSNRLGGQRSLVVFHNRYAETSGRIQFSNPTKVNENGGLVTNSMAEALEIPKTEGLFCVMKDLMDGQYYLFSSQVLHENGMQLKLHAYQCHVFSDFEFVHDNSEKGYAKLCALLQGRGVPDIQQALLSMELEPIHNPMREIFHPEYLNYLMELMESDTAFEQERSLLDETTRKISNLLDGVEYYKKSKLSAKQRYARINRVTSAVLSLINNPSEFPLTLIPGQRIFKKAEQFLLDGVDMHPENRFAFIIASHLLAFETPLIALDEWKIEPMVYDTYIRLGIEHRRAEILTSAARVFIALGDWYRRFGKLTMSELVLQLFSQPEIKRFIKANEYDGIEWFDEDLLRELEWWLVASAYYHSVSTPTKNAVSAHEALIGSYEVSLKIREARLKAEYQLVKFSNYFLAGGKTTV